MRMRYAVMALFVSPWAIQAQDALTIKIRKPAVGDVAHVGKSVLEQRRFQVRDATGKALKDGVEQRNLTFTFIETVLEQQVANQPPTKLKRIYDKAEVESSGVKTALALQGRTVVIEKAGEKYRFSFDNGKALTPEEGEQLEKEFNKKTDPYAFERIMLPGKAVRPNEPWRPDVEKLLLELQKESKMELVAPAGGAQLTKPYVQDGRQCGQIDLAFSFNIKSMPGTKGNTVALNPPGKMSVTLKMDGCIDGSQPVATVSGTVLLQTTLPLKIAENNGGTLTMDVVNSFTEQRTKK